jgi:hypothetical protein
VCARAQYKVTLADREARMRGDRTSAASAVPFDPDFVESLMRVNAEGVRILSECFKDWEAFAIEVRKCLASALSQVVEPFSAAEVLAAYCDRMHRGELRPRERIEEQRLEQLQRAMIPLVMALSDKDQFAELHRLALAKRLVSGKMVGAESESAFLVQLKLLTGQSLVRRCEQLLSNFAEASKSVQLADTCGAIAAEMGVSVSVSVLSRALWPQFRDTSRMQLPMAIAKAAAACARDFSLRSFNKGLVWCHVLGKVEVRCSGFACPDFVVVANTPQAACLSLFNAPGFTVRFSDLIALMGVDADLAKRVAHSLACSPVRLLRKVPDGPIGMDDVFSFNASFATKVRQLVLPCSPIEDPPGEVAAAGAAQLMESRKFAVEAAIVRVMKAHGTLGHAELADSVTRALYHFDAPMRLIKSCVEELIEREFLRRHATQADAYEYLA